MTSAPKLGFFIQPVHPPGRPYAETLREDREAVVLADRLGYHEAFIGEHLTNTAETITSSLAFVASLADHCASIVFGTGVLPLPNYHPVMAAAQVAMVDHLVGGRLLLGIGPGVPADAEAIDDIGTDRHRKTIETIDHMRRLWSEEPPFSIDGEFHRTSTERLFDPDIGVGAMVRPLQRPHPPIVITSIRPDTEGPYEAGRCGWSGISAAYDGGYVLRSHLDGFVAGRESAGLSSDGAGWRIARSIFVADDEATAQRYAYGEDGAHRFYFRVMLTKLGAFGAKAISLDHPDQPDAELTLERVLRRLVIAGTPESVARQILALREEVGPFGTLLYTGHDWVDPALARRSMELMATEVWPRVTEACR